MDGLLLHVSNPRYIESQIIDYIMALEASGISYATIQYLVAPIFTFYQLNDVVLNRKKVSRYLGEYKRVVRDEAYTTEHIQTALQNADARMRMIILLLSSTGARIGSLPGLTLGNLVNATQIMDYIVLCFTKALIMNTIAFIQGNVPPQALMPTFNIANAVVRKSFLMKIHRDGNQAMFLLFVNSLMLMTFSK